MPVITLDDAKRILALALDSGMDREIQYWQGFRDALAQDDRQGSFTVANPSAPACAQESDSVIE